MSNKIPVFRLYPGEFGYLALMLIVSAYMWYGSYAYGGLAGFFPRVMAAIVFVLTFILIARRIRVVPDPVRNIVEGGTGTLTDQTTIGIEAGEDETEDEDLMEETETERTGATRKTAMLGLLTGAYMVFGFLFGLLWGTPLYIIAYLRYTNYSWTLTLAIATIVTVIIYFMMNIFNFALETGMVFEMLNIDIPLSVVGDSLLHDLLPLDLIPTEAI